MSACPLHGYIPMRTLYMGTFPCIPPTRVHSHAYPLHGHIPMHTLYTGTFPCISSTWVHSHAYPLHVHIPMHILYTGTFPCYVHTPHFLTDKAIGEIKAACEESGYVLLVTADHGNAERMIDEDGKPVTKHTTFRGQHLLLPELCDHIP